MRLPYRENSTRPGGTISGAHMMTLAVTTSFNINFLRKPQETDLVGVGGIIKLGKRLAVIEVSIYSDDDIVAHATGAYSIPPVATTN
ncbi:MAG: PaaI family thioesterase [Gammaproteobacteria bacterium]|nr:PaaI family thioesterase [Gammaproteobacteria bacterium]